MRRFKSCMYPLSSHHLWLSCHLNIWLVLERVPCSLYDLCSGERGGGVIGSNRSVRAPFHLIKRVVKRTESVLEMSMTVTRSVGRETFCQDSILTTAIMFTLVVPVSL